MEQMKPYCEDIEVYNTAGKRKSTEASGPTDPVGSWSIEIDTPLGQSIPAALTIERAGSGYTAYFIQKWATLTSDRLRSTITHSNQPLLWRWTGTL
jgi:hypothetical protein